MASAISLVGSALAARAGVDPESSDADRAAPPPHLVDFLEARRRALESATPLPTELVALAAAHGRVLGATLVADADLVPYPRSAMDGFAVRAADTQHAAADRPVTLPVADRTVFAEAAAGLSRHAPHTATAIATGGPLPLGADAVIPVEDVVRRGAAVEIRRSVAPNEDVFPPGDDARRGDVLAQPGALLHPGILGLLAATGHAAVEVVRRPRVAIVCTGDELVAVDALPAHGQIRNSNATMLAAAIADCGADLAFTAAVPDDPERLRIELAGALAAADLVVTTGGASAGPRDFVKAALAELGVTFAFASVALRPAKPAAFGTVAGTNGRPSALVAVLPGNPAAAFIAFVELVRPALLRLGGRTQTALRRVTATLRGGAATAKVGRWSVLFGQLAFDEEDGPVVTPLANQCSSLVRTAAAANALILLPPGAHRHAPGARVSAELLPWE